MSLVIYHHNCFDGFTAAWVANRHLKGNVECMPATYGKNFDKEALLKKIHYRTVYVLDFSYPEHLMVEMAKEAYAIILIDHHKTARWAVNYYPIDNVHNQLEAISKCYSDGLPPLITLFDIERSGAGLTWDFFNPGVKRPKIVEHVEDRDLWKFKNAHTKDIHAYMSSHDFSFENWNKIDSHLSSSDTFYMACHRGDAILAKQEVDINKIIKEQTIKLKIGGHVVPAININFLYASEIGNRLSIGQPFAACYFDTEEGCSFSLRSQSDGLDVSQIAQQHYGGGGHARAAGFTVPYHVLAEMRKL